MKVKKVNIADTKSYEVGICDATDVIALSSFGICI
jgi:hypothetical protein